MQSSINKGKKLNSTFVKKNTLTKNERILEQNLLQAKKFNRTRTNGFSHAPKEIKFDFNEDQILINELSKVIKMRLFIENISLSEDKILDTIKKNLNQISVENLKLSSVNLLVDDLMDIIKRDIKIEKEEKEREKMIAEGKISENLSMEGTLLIYQPRKTLQDYNRRQYRKERNLSADINRKRDKGQRINRGPMRFGNDRKAKKVDLFCLEGQDYKTKGLSVLTDRDLEDLQEKIIDEVSREAIETKGYSYANK